MGMYDTLIINKNLLSLTDEEKELLPENPDWQTKDVVCLMTEVYITDEGKLEYNHHTYKTIDDKESLFGFRMEITNTERIKLHDYHGYINFYTNIKDKWLEFNAKFTDGNLVGITRVENN